MTKTTGRTAAVRALARFIDQLPEPAATEVDTEGLSDAERRLGVAITRTSLQRYLTLAYVLDRFLTQRLEKLEPSLAGVLLSGAAQLLFFDQLPAYAVVNESVKLARQEVRPKAGAMANAVLRKVSRLVRRREPGLAWTPGADRLPDAPGCVLLNDALLPEPTELAAHLSVATSHPKPLVNHWLEQFGPEQTQAVCLHSLTHPPRIVFEPDETHQPWTDTHESLSAYLEADPRRRVQDPTAALPIQALTRLREPGRSRPRPLPTAPPPHREIDGTGAEDGPAWAPQSILDLCAGRGTKTRQLAARFPQALITATDTNAERRAELEQLAAAFNHVEALSPTQATAQPNAYDLIVLDVPCTNTGVLGRRPEARYRYSRKTLTSVAATQRQILEQAATLIRRGGILCYATCSLQHDENQPQTKALARLTHGTRLDERLTLPSQADQPYHDGGYYALVQASP